ncbi:MAG TPA: phosphohydrolase, partial [Candidatus Latescibacteria bacterium]|nr:phosphohydrolase [Candidatus Latescibacterota bacterium]
QRVDEMASQTQEMVPRLIDGDDLIALGYEPGPHFARILAWVEDEHDDGRIVDKASAEEAVSRQFPRS